MLIKFTMELQWAMLFLNLGTAICALLCGKTNLFLYYFGAFILLVGVLRGLTD